MGIRERIGACFILILISIALCILYATGILSTLWGYYDTLCIIVPAIIAVLSFMCYQFIIKGEQQEEHRLKRKGVLCKARVLCIIRSEVRTFDWFTYDGEVSFGRTIRPLYQVRCTFADTEKEKIYDFVSDYTAYDPTPYLKEEIPVYYNIKKPEEYWVDINSLWDNRKGE